MKTSWKFSLNGQDSNASFQFVTTTLAALQRHEWNEGLSDNGHGA